MHTIIILAIVLAAAAVALAWYITSRPIDTGLDYSASLRPQFEAEDLTLWELDDIEYLAWRENRAERLNQALVGTPAFQRALALACVEAVDPDPTPAHGMTRCTTEIVEW